MHRQRLIPRLAYRDAAKAIEFLVAAYGFEETGRFAPEGKVIYSELACGSEIIVAVCSAEEEESDAEPLGSISIELFCEVEDVDGHFAQAAKAGAKITSPPKDQFWGDRSYSSQDAEGYRWIFRQTIKSVDLPDHRPEP